MIPDVLQGKKTDGGHNPDLPSEIQAVEVRDLTVAYQEKPVLWDIDLDIPQGVLMAIVGPNGAGKTTCIKTILGLVKPAAGLVRILGERLNKVRKMVGYVPQRGSVDWDFPTTVLDVVMMGAYGALGWIRRPGKEARQKALDMIKKSGWSSSTIVRSVNFPADSSSVFSLRAP